LRIWIDATDPRSELQLFGMTLLERQLHSIIEAGLTPTAIDIVLPSGVATPSFLSDHLGQRLPIHWVRDLESWQAQLAQAALDANGEPLLVLEADTVVDARLLRYMADYSGSCVALAGEGRERAAVLRLEESSPIGGDGNGRLPKIADIAVIQGTLKELPLDQVPDYVKKLRRHLPIYLFRVPDTQSRDRAERFLFWSNYKGSTDFFTKYVYPPLVWKIVRPLARWHVHPNVVTMFNVFITFAAVPLFAQGFWVPGLILAYAMSVLDSVDGKLARLTFTASHIGNLLDHGLDIVHPPVWYLAWAWALGGGDITSPVLQAAVWMTGFYVLDRIVTAVFNRRTGRSIHGYTPLDERMRTFISRRNINLPLFTIGLLAGVPVFAFVLIVLWQIATLVFHAARLIQCWNGKAVVEAVG
jgi:phosphatidylglycerophosphate synthase